MYFDSWIFLSKLYFASINYLGADEMFIVY